MSASCGDHCTCADGCPERGLFLVTACKDDGTWVPLLGPYPTHSLALSLVATAREFADKVAPAQAPWWSYGTAQWLSTDDPCPIGRLNETIATCSTCGCKGRCRWCLEGEADDGAVPCAACGCRWCGPERRERKQRRLA